MPDNGMAVHPRALIPLETGPSRCYIRASPRTLRVMSNTALPDET